LKILSSLVLAICLFPITGTAKAANETITGWAEYKDVAVKRAGSGAGRFYFKKSGASNKEAFIKICKERCEGGKGDGRTGCGGFVLNYKKGTKDKTKPAYCVFKSNVMQSVTKAMYRRTSKDFYRYFSGLPLRVHIMRGIEMTVDGTKVNTNHITIDTVRNKLLPEVNKVWQQAGIKWIEESIILEKVVKSGKTFSVWDENDKLITKSMPADYPQTYAEKIKFIPANGRLLKDKYGKLVTDPDKHLMSSADKKKKRYKCKSNSKRSLILFSMMEPNNRSGPNQLGTELFHLYIWPFTGDTSQGNAFRTSNESKSLGLHTSIGAWSNKYNTGSAPADHDSAGCSIGKKPGKMVIKETWTGGDTVKTNIAKKYHGNPRTKGSMGLTAAHELGHVLSLNHPSSYPAKESSEGCKDETHECLMGSGYHLTKPEIKHARETAKKRLESTCTKGTASFSGGLGNCGYSGSLTEFFK